MFVLVKWLRNDLTKQPDYSRLVQISQIRLVK